MSLNPVNCFTYCVRYFKIILFSILLLFLSISPIIAQSEVTSGDSLKLSQETELSAYKPLPPLNIKVADSPDDAGGAIDVSWELSPDDYAGGKVMQYRILRAESINGQTGIFKEVGDATAGATSIADGNTTDGVDYFYKVMAVNSFYDTGGQLLEIVSDSVSAGPITSSAQWFHFQRINSLVGIALLTFFIIYFISQAKAGKKLFIRKMAGMEAVHEAVGRATEMGKKIFYISGLGDMDNMQTIASMTILGRVAELSAEYETYLDVPVCRSLVMVTASEVVKEAYSRAGRPDSYNDNQVHYLTDDQFGYAAGVDGMFVREKPATIFFMGQFFAESLILAETGNSIGAIQIAGTAMPSQLPFFVAACDYTLIGEELFAASAYLSKEPKLLGSLKGQDIGKGLILIAIIIGLILETFNIWQLSNLFSVID